MSDINPVRKLGWVWLELKPLIGQAGEVFSNQAENNRGIEI